MINGLISAIDPAQDHGLSISRVTYEIFESGLDPVKQWELVGRDANGNEHCCVRFKTYGEAWRELERRKAMQNERRMERPTGLADTTP